MIIIPLVRAKYQVSRPKTGLFNRAHNWINSRYLSCETNLGSREPADPFGLDHGTRIGVYNDGEKTANHRLPRIQI